MKPFAESCEQNKDVIFSVIQPLLQNFRSLLEIGSGTGQHAVYFAPRLPHLQWQTSELRENHPGIRLWLAESQATNILPPVALDVLEDSWPNTSYDAIFSANTLHIMHWPEVEAFFSGAGNILNADGLMLLYGPFNYHGEYSSESNARFDEWLKLRDPQSGIRDIDDLLQLAKLNHLQLVDDIAMPANNRLLCFKAHQSDNRNRAPS